MDFKMPLFNRKRLAILSLISIATLLFVLYFALDDLDQRNIVLPSGYRPEWDLSSLNAHDQAIADKILEQPFIYLDEGGQSSVYLSADGDTVLKLFKFKRFRPYFFVNLLPDTYPFKSFRDRHIAAREKKLLTVFKGYKIAYELHRHESGLLLVQLNPAPSTKSITLVDKYHRERKIDLNDVSYILQESGAMLSKELSRILDQGNVPLAKKRIDQLFDLYLSEYRKGFYDADHGVIHNIGYKNGYLFHLDVGKFTLDERMKDPAFYKKDLNKVMAKVQLWINHKYPQYAQELNSYIKHVTQGIS